MVIEQFHTWLFNKENVCRSGSFVDLYLKGIVRIEQIDEYMDAWCRGSGADLLLEEWLGMTFKQFASWEREPCCNLHRILLDSK